MEEFELELLELDILYYFEYKYGIPKSIELDNPAYYPMYRSDKRYNLIRGGRGSAKSFEGCGRMPVILISCLPFCRIMVIRQIHNTHTNSTFQEICDYINKWELNEFFHITKTPLKVTHLESGNYIVFKGMDKPLSLKSVKDVTHVIFEEAFEIKDIKAIDIVDKSIRTPAFKIGGCHKLFFLFNPDNKSHWLYEQFYDESEESKRKFASYRESAFYLKTTYKDNQFAHPSFIRLIEADKIADPERYLVDGLGEWGSIKETGLFYRFFDYASSVEIGLKKRIYNVDAPLHITFDFNVYPYVSLEVSQLSVNKTTTHLEFCTIEEICLTDKSVMGNLQATVKEFINRYKGHKGTVVVCGDRAGHSRKTNAIPDFATIFAMLQITPKSKYQSARAENGQIVSINPHPEYEQAGCTFKVTDGTIHTQNPRLKQRKILFERLHQGRLKVLPLDRNNGTINAAGQKRPLSEQYPNLTIIQKIDEACKFLIKDYQNLKEDVVSGGKSDRNAELGHTSDAMDYQICQIFDAEFNYIIKELKL